MLMSMRSWNFPSLSSWLAMGSLLTLGCGSGVMAPPPETMMLPPLARVEQPPQAAPAPPRSAVKIDGAPSRLSTVRGVVAVGVQDQLHRGNLLGDGLLSSMALVADPGDPMSMGGVRWLARRSSGGLFVAADAGLYHDDTGRLARSPLSKSLGGRRIATLDAFVGDGGEELWLATDQGGVWVGRQQVVPFQVTGAMGLPDLAVGIATQRALVAFADLVYLVDLEAKQATPIAKGLGRAWSFDRSDDGTVYLATDGGLLVRRKDGGLTRHTFAAAGSPPRQVKAVSALYGRVYAFAGADLVLLDGDGSKVVTPVAAPSPQGLTVDANGDLWILDGGVARLALGAAVSFAKDVRPFLAQHCGDRCHTMGRNGAPKLQLTEYGVAKEMAGAILKRLRAEGTPPMPPANVEILTARDYAVVVKWTSGGLQP